MFAAAAPSFLSRALQLISGVRRTLGLSAPAWALSSLDTLRLVDGTNGDGNILSRHGLLQAVEHTDSSA